jgi:hypothetical protein
LSSTFMPNTSCSILRALSINLIEKNIFDGINVKRISFWLHLENLTLILAIQVSLRVWLYY